MDIPKIVFSAQNNASFMVKNHFFRTELEIKIRQVPFHRDSHAELKSVSNIELALLLVELSLF